MKEERLLRFRNETLKVAVAQICQVIGFQGINSTPLEVLIDLLHRYLTEVARLTHRYAEHFNRTEPNLNDLSLTFDELGITLPELEEYVNTVESPPFPHNVPKFPVPRTSNLNFLKPGAHEILSRPIHVHEHLPPMHPEKEEDEYDLKVSADNDEDALLDSETSTRSPGSAAHGKRMNDDSPSSSPNKRYRLTHGDEGSAVREIISVMMTTSGFISSGREGKLPEARAPNIPLVMPRSSSPSGLDQMAVNRKKLSMEKLIRHKNSQGSTGLSMGGPMKAMVAPVRLRNKEKPAGKMLKIPTMKPGTPMHLLLQAKKERMKEEGGGHPKLKIPIPKGTGEKKEKVVSGSFKKVKKESGRVLSKEERREERKLLKKAAKKESARKLPESMADRKVSKKEKRDRIKEREKELISALTDSAAITMTPLSTSKAKELTGGTGALGDKLDGKSKLSIFKKVTKVKLDLRAIKEGFGDDGKRTSEGSMAASRMGERTPKRKRSRDKSNGKEKRARKHPSCSPKVVSGAKSPVRDGANDVPSSPEAPPLFIPPFNAAPGFIPPFSQFPFIPPFMATSGPPVSIHPGLPDLRLPIPSLFLSRSAKSDVEHPADDSFERVVTPTRPDFPITSPVPSGGDHQPVVSSPGPLTPVLSPSPVRTSKTEKLDKFLLKAEKEKRKEHKRERKEKDKDRVKKKKDKKDKEKRKKEKERDREKITFPNEVSPPSDVADAAERPLAVSSPGKRKRGRPRKETPPTPTPAHLVPPIKVKLPSSAVDLSPEDHRVSPVAENFVMPKLIIKPIIKRQDEDITNVSSVNSSSFGGDVDHPGSPELAKFSALITRPPKKKHREAGEGPFVPVLKIKEHKDVPTLKIKEHKDVPTLKIKEHKDVPTLKIKEHKDVPTLKIKSFPPPPSSDDKLIDEVNRNREKKEKKEKRLKEALVTSPVPSAKVTSPTPPEDAAASTNKIVEQQQSSGLISETIGPIGHFVDDHGNEVWICPTCAKQDDGTPMIGCDTCDDWYHWVCVGIQVAPSDDANWYCPRCISKHQRGVPIVKKKRGRKKKIMM